MSSRGIVGGLCCLPAAEARYEWKVENFFSLSEKIEDRYESPDFEIFGRTFNLRLIYKKPYAIIMLCTTLKVSMPPIKIRFALGIKTAEGDTEVLECGSRELSIPCYFSSKSMEISELLNRRQQLAPCGAVTFTASLKIDVSRPDIGTTDVAVQTCQEDIIDLVGNGGHQILEKSDFATFCQNIEEVEGKDSDVSLQVWGMEFRVHKFILEARAPALAATLSDNASEAETGVVCVEDCHPEAFEVFLRFVYGGVTENLTIENATDVYYVAKKYDLPRLKKECVRHMLSNLTTASVCSVIDMAHRHGEELLQERASDFLVENAGEVFQTAVWRKFTQENYLAYDLIVRVIRNWK